MAHYIVLETIFIVLLYVLGFLGAIHALLKKGEPRSALIWVCVCLFFPFFGVLIYIVFGVNQVQVFTKQWRSKGFSSLKVSQGKKIVHQDFQLSDFDPAFNSLNRVSEKLFASKLSSGCEVKILYDGSEAYPAMLAAINEASTHICLSTYIFGTQGIGQDFIEALYQAKCRGVDVKVLIDGVGALYTWPWPQKKLKALGVPVVLFLPLWQSIKNLRYLNLRNHRKIMIVDGKIGFTGGMNLHEDNFALSGKTALIHDLHFQVQGPVVGALQDAFLRTWYFINKAVPEEQVYYDDQEKGEMGARGIATGPYQELPLIPLVLVAAINAAKKHIRIMTPYFVVGLTVSTALVEAALRGVEVELILPEANNLSFVKGATETILPPLLNMGIKVYYRLGNFAHSKIFICDDVYVFLGSANMDIRSFLLNFEFNLEVYSKVLANKLIQHFEVIKKNSREITFLGLQKQNFMIKLRNSICKLFSPYL